MKTFETIKNIVEQALNDKLGEYPHSMRPSPEGDGAISVYIYAVPKEKVALVKETLYDIEEQCFPECDVCLVPMVKNIQTTRAYYPQYLPVFGRGWMEALLSAGMNNGCKGFKEKVSQSAPKESSYANVAKNEFALAA